MGLLQMIFRNKHYASSSFRYLSNSCIHCSHMMKVPSSSSMKLSSALLLLIFIIGSMLLSTGSARRCRGNVQGSSRTGVCVPRFVCPGGRPRRNTPRCGGGTICCIGPLLRCNRSGRPFITRRIDCRPGNDRGPLFRSAPDFIRCCSNPPPPLP